MIAPSPQNLEVPDFRQKPVCPCGCSSGSGGEGPLSGGWHHPLSHRPVVGVGTSAVSDLGVDRHRAKGSGRFPGTPQRAGHWADDSNRPRPGHPVARSRNPVSHTGTRPGGRNIKSVDHSNPHTEGRNHPSVPSHTGESEHPGTGGSGLNLPERDLHVGFDSHVHAAVATAGADIVVGTVAAVERATAGAGAAAAAETAAKASTAAAAGKAAAVGTTAAAAAGTTAAAGPMAAAAGKAAAAGTTAAAAGRAVADAGKAAMAGSAAAVAVGAAAAARSAAVEADIAVGAPATAVAAVSAGIAVVEHTARPVPLVEPVGWQGLLQEPYRLSGHWALACHTVWYHLTTTLVEPCLRSVVDLYLSS